MGIGKSKQSNLPLDSANHQQRDAEISKQLNEQKIKQSQEVKILFFGLPGCGGTLIMNKIREYVQSQKQSSKENPNAAFKEIIQYHTLRSIQQIIHASTKLDLPLWSESREKNEQEQLTQILSEIRSTHFCFNQTTITKDLGAKIKTIWALRGAKQIYNQRDNEQVAHLTDLKTAERFLNDIERISDPSFIPSDEDIKFYHENFNQDCRGVDEMAFEFSDHKYRIFNVEGQIGEKRKWIHHFDSVDIVCLLCPLGDYDAPPVAEGRKNVVNESYILFKELCAVRAFHSTPVIVLLCKYDDFLEKIMETDLICCFDDYLGGCVEKDAIKFITTKFLKLKEPEKVAPSRKKSFNSAANMLDIFEQNKASGSNELKDGDLGEVYINFVSKQFTLQEIINNLGGTMKNIQFMKHLNETEKKEKEEKAAQQANAVVQTPRQTKKK